MNPPRIRTKCAGKVLGIRHECVTPMPLTPKNPPGRANRKARAFQPEMQRLRADGYTLEQIREALADAGVHVDVSTVRREIARRGVRRTETKLEPPDKSPTTPAAQAGPITAVKPVASDPRSGKDIAEAFVRNRTVNPLLRSKEPR